MKISVYGDSVLECVRLGEDGKYVRSHELVSCFEAEHNVVIENRSKFGATIERGFSRLQHDLERGGLGSYTVLEYGGNDCAYRWAEVAAAPEAEHVCMTPPDRFREIYREMIDLVYKNGSWPIVSTLPPISSHRYLDFVSRWQESYSRIAEELAKDRGCLILDLRSAFPASGDELDACLCSDGIHPDLAGQQLIYKRASESIKKLLG